MAFKHDKNTGSFFKNDYKTEDKHPAFTGTCNIDGKELDIAVWHNPAKENKKENYFFKVSEPREKKDSTTTTTPSPEFSSTPPF